MAKRGEVLYRHSPAWDSVFGFGPEPSEFAAVEGLKAIGIREVAFQLGRTMDGAVFTNLMSVLAEKGQAVDVACLMQVRQLCEGMGPQLFSETVAVAGPDGDEPESDCRDLLADGELLLFVRVLKRKEILMSVDVVIPAAHLIDAEVGA